MSGQRFLVRAMDASQRIVEIKIDALDEADLERQVATRNLVTLTCRATSRSLGSSFGSRAAKFDLLLFVQELNALVSAGLSITETLDTLLERTSTAQGQLVLQRLLEHLKQGLRLSQAMQQQPEVFPPLLVGVIQSSEDTSDLPRALLRYLQYETQLQGLRHKITSAAIYPVILISVGSLVALFLLGYVVPKFAGVYQNGSRELPVASHLLLLTGQWIAEHRGLTSSVLGAGILGLAWKLSELKKSGQWWRVLRFVPGATPRLEVLELSRLYLTMSMLLEGGLPIERAMHLASSVLMPARQLHWQKVRHQVYEGSSLTSAMEAHGFCTNVAQRLLRVGERSGQIGMMLGKAAAFYESETARWIEQFTKTFEPVLMAIIGIVIGLIVILLYIPVFDLAGSIQ